MVIMLYLEVFVIILYYLGLLYNFLKLYSLIVISAS